MLLSYPIIWGSSSQSSTKFLNINMLDISNQRGDMFKTKAPSGTVQEMSNILLKLLALKIKGNDNIISCRSH